MKRTILLSASTLNETSILLLAAVAVCTNMMVLTELKATTVMKITTVTPTLNLLTMSNAELSIMKHTVTEPSAEELPDIEP